MRRYACLPRRVRFFIASLLIRVWNFTGSCVRTASPTGQLLRRMTKLSTEAQIQDEPTRRDFLFIATAAMGAVGVGGLAWPFIAQMNPDASALALSTSEVDIGSMQPGEQVSVMWRGKPVFIRYRTEEEIAEAEAVDVNDLPDGNARLDVDPGLPATNENRSVPENPALLLMTRRLHASWLYPAVGSRRFWRLVLPLSWLALRHGGPNSPRSGAGKPAHSTV
jgi:Rieske Fe-S protein